MLRRNVVVQLQEDIDSLSNEGSKFVIIEVDPVYTKLVEINKNDEGYFEEFTDTLARYLEEKKIKIVGKHKVKLGEVYCNHEGKSKIVPQMKITSKETKEVIIVYKILRSKIKNGERLSNQFYFITINEFLNKYVYLGEL